jgi:hypothetical protein
MGSVEGGSSAAHQSVTTPWGMGQHRRALLSSNRQPGAERLQPQRGDVDGPRELRVGGIEDLKAPVTEEARPIPPR